MSEQPLANPEFDHERGLSVEFDREKLEALRSVATEGARQVVETVMQLPKLEFEPGVTIIVGENGAGKSSIGQAIYWARKVQETGKTLEQMADDDNVGPELVAAGPLVVGLAEAVKLSDAREGSVTDLVNYGEAHSHDAQRRVGREQRRRSPMSYIDSLGNTHTRDAEGASNLPRFTAEASTGYDEALGLPFLGNQNEHMSTRQSMDNVLADRAHMRAGQKAEASHVLTVLDEPEVGLSPRRQIAELDALITRDAGGPEAVAIVPTNSVALFQRGDIQRIDLDYPALGIHRADEVNYAEYVAADLGEVKPPQHVEELTDSMESEPVQVEVEPAAIAVAGLSGRVRQHTGAGGFVRAGYAAAPPEVQPAAPIEKPVGGVGGFVRRGF